ncbi:MAG: hypothetical protein J6K19_11295, partial [Prevotella sp.]|nr:hypothetical protein [Prevotella sp.]
AYSRADRIFMFYAQRHYVTSQKPLRATDKDKTLSLQLDTLQADFPLTQPLPRRICNPPHQTNLNAIYTLPDRYISSKYNQNNSLPNIRHDRH